MTKHRRLPINSRIIGWTVAGIGVVASAIAILQYLNGLLDGVSFDIIRWGSIAFSGILLAAVLLLRQKVSRSEEAIRRLVSDQMNVSRRFVRTLRSITLAEIPRPDLRDVIEPMLNEIGRSLPRGGAGYKLSVARPNHDGTFRILAERGMDPASVSRIESMASWKGRRSFYSNLMHMDSSEAYHVFKTGETNYVDIQSPGGSGDRVTSAGAHLIAGFRQPDSYSQFPMSTLALVSVGIPKEDYDGVPEQDQRLYESIYPALKGIEAVLLAFDACEEREVDGQDVVSDTTWRHKSLE